MMRRMILTALLLAIALCVGTRRTLAVENSTDAKKDSAPEVPEKKSEPVLGKDGVLDVNFDHLKFPIEKGQAFEKGQLTDAVRALNGKKIRVRGFMLPSYQQRGISEFVLVRDNMECCFGPGAMLYDCVVIKMAKGTAQYSTRPITVEGTFKLETLKDPDENVMAVFHIDAIKAN